VKNKKVEERGVKQEEGGTQGKGAFDSYVFLVLKLRKKKGNTVVETSERGAQIGEGRVKLNQKDSKTMIDMKGPQRNR